MKTIDLFYLYDYIYIPVFQFPNLHLFTSVPFCKVPSSQEYLHLTVYLPTCISTQLTQPALDYFESCQ